MEPLLLLREVREISLLVSPAEPKTVSQRAFDAARARATISTSLPAARQIAAELHLPWREVLTIAHKTTRQQNQLLGLAGRDALPGDSVTDERIAYVLRLVAGRLGVTTLTRGAYDAERAALFAADRRDWLHGRRLRLPSAETIRAAAGGWGAALWLAGLDAHALPPQKIKQTILSRLDVMDRFYDHYGEQPTHKGLLEFARGNKLPMSGEDERLWSESVAAWRQRRDEHGLPEPHVVKRRGGLGADGRPLRAPDFSADVGAARPGEHRHKGKWADENACVEWVARYLATLGKGERSTVPGYKQWVRQNPGAPAASTFDQHGGWGTVRRKALERVSGRSA